MTCDICKNFEHIHAQNIEELFDELMEVLCDEELESLSIVADEENTKKLVYCAINGEYDIGSIELNTYDYDGPYIVTISWEDDNYEITVEIAQTGDGDYLACAGKTFVQYDLPEKCEYINSVMENKFVTPDIEIFELGDVIDEDDESDDDDELYTYANEYRSPGVFGQIFVSSNIKDYVEAAKSDFESLFLED